ncbi:MAG: hypothetical protein WBA91_07680 [Paracoccaceae bacterium]
MSAFSRFSLKTVALKFALAAFVWAGPSHSASAATITFATLPDEGALATSYSENGILATATGGLLAFVTGPGLAHIDDAGTSLTNAVNFTTGGLFDAISFDLISLGYDFIGTPGGFPNNIVVTGFLGGSSMTSATFLLSDVPGQAQSFLLGPAFMGIDLLRIALSYPATGAPCGAPCGHFDLDSVTLAPVPLPASLWILASGGLMLAGVRARRARS